MALILSCGECRRVAQQYVQESLGHPAVAYVDFAFGCLRVHGWNMRAIANLVGSGSIGATYDQAGTTLRQGTGAQYNPRTDTITLGSFDRSHVIHEAIHALQDTVRYPTRVTEAEATAYLGQVVYQIAREALSTGTPMGTVAARYEASSSAIRAAAARVARRLGMLNRCHVVVSHADLAEIEQAIAAHPIYRDHAQGNYRFDGTP